MSKHANIPWRCIFISKADRESFFARYFIIDLFICILAGLKQIYPTKTCSIKSHMSNQHICLYINHNILVTITSSYLDSNSYKFIIFPITLTTLNLATCILKLTLYL